jgi:predicted lipoprotein with Yx(FWY)xxD motif
MLRRPRLLPLVAAVAVAGIAVAAASSAAFASDRAAAGTHATVAVRRVGSLGRILVDGQGRTLYLFMKDKGGRSACSGACAKAWPPLLTSGAPRATRGAMAAKLGTTRRTDGTTQVTYAGHPLYRFARDARPGQANGEGLTAFGAAWYVLSATGRKIDRS